MAPLTKIAIHWTAGSHKPSATDLAHYHYIIDKDGKVHKGKHKPEDNMNCNDGNYAAHTGGGNTGTIGVAMCGMYGFKSAANPGKYPITAQQIEACFALCAKLAKKYKIQITPDTVFTHYEFGKKNTKTTSYGKIDIIHIPSYPKVSKDNVGTFIRSKIAWYLPRVSENSI